MSTNASRQKRYYIRRLAAKNDRRLTLWLSEQAWKRLDKMRLEEPFRHLGVSAARDRIITEALVKLDSQRLWTRQNLPRV